MNAIENLSPVLLQHVDRPPVREPVTTRARFRIVLAVYAAQLLHLLDDLHRVLLDQGLVRQELVLPAAAVELR